MIDSDMRSLVLAAALLISLAQAQADAIFKAAHNLGRGINFGNALEAPKEGDWGMVLSEDYFRLVKEVGFNSIRLPISWTHHTSKEAPYAIDPAFFERIDWALEQASLNDLNLIINNHHHEEINTDPQGEEARFLAIWQQIAERYQDAPNTVYFELLNEPHGIFNSIPEYWNNLLAKTLAVVRESNPGRPVIIGPVGWNALGRLKDLKLPDDPHIIVTIHYYEPFAFTHQGAEWVSPPPPLGKSWTGVAGEWAPSWQNWSWDSKVTLLETTEPQVQIEYKEGWAGLYLHSDSGAENYTTLSLSTDRPIDLLIVCNKNEAQTIAITTQGDHQPNEVSLRDCGIDKRFNDLFLQNNSETPQEPYILSKLELRSPENTLSLIANEASAIRSAFKAASDWARTNNRPVLLGEFGAYDKAEQASRLRWTEFVRREAEALGFAWTYWEFGAGFGIYDRSLERWHEDLLNRLVGE